MDEIKLPIGTIVTCNYGGYTFKANVLCYWSHDGRAKERLLVMSTEAPAVFSKDNYGCNFYDHEGKNIRPKVLSMLLNPINRIMSVNMENVLGYQFANRVKLKVKLPKINTNE